MTLIYLALTLALLLVNFAALALVFERWLPDRQIARAGGVLAICLPLFFVEHFVGLGRLFFLWPLTTLAAMPLLRRRLVVDRSFLKGELPFVLPLLVALLWRYGYPDIEPTAEQITDLYFVSNYIGGDWLPPPDRWLPGHRFDVYYGFLHYGVALLARWLGLDAGSALNLGGAVVFGLLGSLGWSVASRFVDRAAPRVLIVAALILGGTGIAPLLVWLFPGDATAQIWANTRFAGLYDQNLRTPLGQSLFPKLNASAKPSPDFEPRDLPLETPSYFLYLGDVHPPLGGFVLLLFALALIARLERSTDRDNPRVFAFALGSTAVIPLALNTWIFPLHTLLVAGWAAHRWRGRAPLHAQWVAGGALAAAILIYPFLSYFALNAVATPLVRTAAIDHTPWRQGLAIWWPVLWLVILSLLQGPKERLAWWSALGVVAVWLLAEFVTVDDRDSGRYQRFNTVLKWWSWLYPAALVWLAALNFGAPQRWRRALAAVPLIATLLYLLPQANYWLQTPRAHAGRLQGDGWVQADPAQRAILDWLKAAPRGVVLESVERGAYNPSSTLALFSGQHSALGWPDHVSQWRGGVAFINERAQIARALYRGERTDAAQWLKLEGIEYVVWGRLEATYGREALTRLKSQLAGAYAWMPLWTQGGEEYGVFRRLPTAGAS